MTHLCAAGSRFFARAYKLGLSLLKNLALAIQETKVPSQVSKK